MYFMSEFYIKGAALQGKSASHLAAFHYVVYFTPGGECGDFFEGWQEPGTTYSSYESQQPIED